MHHKKVPPTPSGPQRGEPLALPLSPHRLDLRPHQSRVPVYPSVPTLGNGDRELPSSALHKNRLAPRQHRGTITLSSRLLRKPSRRWGKHAVRLNFVTSFNPEQRVNVMLAKGFSRFALLHSRVFVQLRAFKRSVAPPLVYTVALLRSVVSRVFIFSRSFIQDRDGAVRAAASTEGASVLNHALSPLPFSSVHGEKNKNNKEAHATTLSAEPPHLRRYGGLRLRRKEAIVYFCIALAGVLILQITSSIVDLQHTQGKVLGEATAGVQSLMHAQAMFSRDDMNSALQSFLEAEERFSNASDALAQTHFSSVFARLPMFRSGSSLIAVGELTSSAAEHILIAMKSLDEARATFSSGPTVRISVQSVESLSPQPFSTPSSPSDGVTGLSLPSLETAGRHLSEASQALKRAHEYMGTIDTQYIPVRYHDAYATMGQVLSPASRLTARAAHLLELVSAIMGSHGPRRIVFIFQNDAELRPTGGFMGSFAYVDTAQGKITSLTVPGGGFYDFKGSMTARVDAPHPFHLFSPYWQPWNANYLFDFPSSARTIQWFIEKSQGPTIDAIIAVTPTLLEDLLTLTGPVVLPDYQLAFSQINVRRALQEEVEHNYDRVRNQPKAVIGALLPVIIERLPQILKDDPTRLMRVAARALDRRDILVWSQRPDEQRLIRSIGWGGEVVQEGGDYLALVHTNIGGGKTDRVMEDAWERMVTFDEQGSATAVFTFTRTHRGNPSDIFEKVHNVDYLRLFVPKGSELINARGFKQPDKSLFKYEKDLEQQPELASLRFIEHTRGSALGVRTSEEHGYTVFGGWVMTKVRETSVVALTYRLPSTIMPRGGIVQAALGAPHHYQLTVQRQPGALDVPFHDRLVAPSAWGAFHAEGNFRSLEGSTISSVIGGDIRYKVVWGG